jgi:hypothetical protein
MHLLPVWHYHYVLFTHSDNCQAPLFAWPVFLPRRLHSGLPLALRVAMASVPCPNAPWRLLPPMASHF